MSGYLWRGQPGLEELNADILAARDPDAHPERIIPFSWDKSWRDSRSSYVRLSDRETETEEGTP